MGVKYKDIKVWDVVQHTDSITERTGTEIQGSIISRTDGTGATKSEELTRST